MRVNKWDKLVKGLDRLIRRELEEYDELVDKNSKLNARIRELSAELERSNLSRTKDRLKVRISELETQVQDLEKANEELREENQRQLEDWLKKCDEVEKLKAKK